jgi:hypothetical protein
LILAPIELLVEVDWRWMEVDGGGWRWMEVDMEVDSSVEEQQ